MTGILRKSYDTIVQWTIMSIQMNEDSGLNEETIFGTYLPVLFGCHDPKYKHSFDYIEH